MDGFRQSTSMTFPPSMSKYLYLSGKSVASQGLIPNFLVVYSSRFVLILWRVLVGYSSCTAHHFETPTDSGPDSYPALKNI